MRGTSALNFASAQRIRHERSSYLFIGNPIRLSGTTVENLDWQNCIKRYDRTHTFFYLDPPYWQVEGYGVPFEIDQYDAMAAIMRNCCGKVMVSINDHPDIRRAFAGLMMHELGINLYSPRSWRVDNADVDVRRSSPILVF